MSRLTPVTFQQTDIDSIATATGRVAVIVTPDGVLDQAARRANKLTKGAVARLLESARFAKAKPGQVITLAWTSSRSTD